MNARRSSGGRTHVRQGRDGGFLLMEIMVSLALVVIIAGGTGVFAAAVARANDVDRMSLALLNTGQAKIEQVQTIPYEQVGIVAVGTASGVGYFVRDPFYEPVYAVANGDVLLSDTLTLADGTVVTRTVTVTAIDDPTDGTGSEDLDGVVDPNTLTMLDYKLVTVTMNATGSRLPAPQQSLTTILQGALPSEVEGETGEDATGPPQKLNDKTIETEKAISPLPPPADCDVLTLPPAGKGPGKKGKSKQSCSGDDL